MLGGRDTSATIMNGDRYFNYIRRFKFFLFVKRQFGDFANISSAQLKLDIDN